MNEETREALIESIKKWERNLRAAESGQYEEVDTSWRTCALCVKFAHEHGMWTCTNCPVHLRTGRTGCENTPYRGVNAELERCAVNSALIVATVSAEVKFLKALLPPPVETPCEPDYDPTED